MIRIALKNDVGKLPNLLVMSRKKRPDISGMSLGRGQVKRFLSRSEQRTRVQLDPFSERVKNPIKTSHRPLLGWVSFNKDEQQSTSNMN